MRMTSQVLVAIAACFAGQVEGDSRTARPADTSRRVDFTYSVTVRELPAEAERARLWIPIPKEHPWQTLERTTVHSDLPHQKLTEKAHGNRYYCFDLTEAVARGKSTVKVSVTYRVVRKAVRVLDNMSTTRRPLRKQRSVFLQPDRLVPVGGRIKREAERVAGDARTPLKKAWRLYDHVVGSMRYAKVGEGWGRGDARYACKAREGNCTDFHSLFLGEARALGLPARFLIGFPLPPDQSSGEVGGYHCWAEFWLKGYGWVPLDASEASKHPKRKKALFGGLDANRIEFTMGRDIKLPRSEAEPVNFSIYPHVEVGKKVHEKVSSTFRFQDVE